jgi:hypothetical protein
MAIQVERLDGEAIIVYRYPEKLESNQEIRDALVAENDIAEAMPDPVIWVIHDTSRLKIQFGRLVTALATLTREGPEGFDDPRLHVAVVSNSELIKFAAKAASQPQYGGWKAFVFDTYEQALAHTRANLAQQKG